MIKVLAVAVLLLSGCSGIEHRSEVLVKKPLAKHIQPEEISAKKLWSRSVGVSNNTRAQLIVTMRRGVLVTTDLAGKVTAIRVKSGKILWQRKLKRAIIAGAQLAQDKVLLVTKDAQLVALQAKDGTTLWQAQLNSVALAAPIAHDGVVYVHTTAGSLVALDANNGRKLWEHNSVLPSITLHLASQPVIYQDYIVVGFANGKLTALSREDGAVAWEVAVKNPAGRSDIQRMVDISATPVVYNNHIYVVGSKGNLVAVHGNSGKKVWQRDIKSLNGLVVAKRKLFVADSQGVLWSLNRSNGTVLWKQDALYGRSLTKPAFFKNTVVVADDDGLVHWIDGSHGQIVGRLTVNSKAISAPIMVANGVLYVLSSSGTLTAYALQHKRLAN